VLGETATNLERWEIEGGETRRKGLKKKKKNKISSKDRFGDLGENKTKKGVPAPTGL